MSSAGSLVVSQKLQNSSANNNINDRPDTISRNMGDGWVSRWSRRFFL